MEKKTLDYFFSLRGITLGCFLTFNRGFSSDYYIFPFNRDTTLQIEAGSKLTLLRLRQVLFDSSGGS